MSDYISREAALESICFNCFEHSMGDNNFCGIPCDDYERVSKLPAADVREVVLCRDCCLHDSCYAEDVFKFARLADDNRFCGCGKVKTNGAEMRGKDDDV